MSERARRRERGASSAEYVGVVVVTAVLVGAIVLAISPQGANVRAAVCDAVGSILRTDLSCGSEGEGEEDAGQPTDEDFAPPVCQVSQTGEQVNSTVSGEKWVLAAETDGAGIQVADPFDDSRTAAGAIGSLQFPATMKLDGYQPGEGRDNTVEGADTALLQTFTYEDGGETAQGAWIIASQRQPSASVAVTIGGTEVDKALISHVVDTLRYQHSDEPVPDANEQS